MKITGTFLDEISYDIPHQNWGKKEWDADFQLMRSVGIDTVILIRCGLARQIAYPSKYLMDTFGCMEPAEDLVELFLNLADKYGMDFYFGTYDSMRCWDGTDDFDYETRINLPVVDEVWSKYGHHKSFKGWYLSVEISRRRQGAAEAYAELGRYCKKVSGGLPVMISPFLDPVEPGDDHENAVQQHRMEWDNILRTISGAVDIVAFQDGTVPPYELEDFLKIGAELMQRYNIHCWTNCESFDRDMPIHFLPIKWEKMWHKLKAADNAGIEKAITFEFSHFMSSNSIYRAAGNLLQRYCEHFGIQPPGKN